MRKRIFSFMVIVLGLLALIPANGQTGKGIVSGDVKDSGGAVLQGP